MAARTWCRCWTGSPRRVPTSGSVGRDARCATSRGVAGPRRGVHALSLSCRPCTRRRRRKIPRDHALRRATNPNRWSRLPYDPAELPDRQTVDGGCAKVRRKCPTHRCSRAGGRRARPSRMSAPRVGRMMRGRRSFGRTRGRVTWTARCASRLPLALPPRRQRPRQDVAISLPNSPYCQKSSLDPPRIPHHNPACAIETPTFCAWRPALDACI